MKNDIGISNDLAKPLTETNIEWNLYLYKKRHKKGALNSYEMYKVNTLNLTNIYSDVHNYILKNFINKKEICQYTTEMPKGKIGYIDLSIESNILNGTLPLLRNGIDSSTLFSGTIIPFHGYILECLIEGQPYIQIFTTSNPIKLYKHRYCVLFDKLTEIKDPVLALSHTCDCIIKSNEYALFFTNRAESIFDLEKHYKALANRCLENLKNTNLFANFDSFATYSSVWPKAAKFETFNPERINTFSKFDYSKKFSILQDFGISLNENGAIIANSPEDNEKALKFICGKFLKDFDNNGYEVSYPQRITPR